MSFTKRLSDSKVISEEFERLFAFAAWNDNNLATPSRSYFTTESYSGPAFLPKKVAQLLVKRHGQDAAAPATFPLAGNAILVTLAYEFSGKLYIIMFHCSGQTLEPLG